MKLSSRILRQRNGDYSVGKNELCKIIFRRVGYFRKVFDALKIEATESVILKFRVRWCNKNI